MGTTAAQKKLFFNLRKAKNKIGALEEGELRLENAKKIATQLGVTTDEVISMNRRLGGGGDASLNAPLGGDSDGVAEWQDWLADDEADQAAAFADRQEMNQRRELLIEAMTALNERERHIITERKLKDEPVTLEQLSEVYGVSRERIRQIEARGFEKLQRRMRDLAAEQGLMQPAD
jgi:RNA polymerase sigma-32 factor